MKHYSIEQWVDFVRDAVSTELRSAMQRHLEWPCRKCRDSVTFWRRVLTRASKRGQHQPPDEAVKQVKALFGLIKPFQEQRSFFSPVEEIFDSSLQPAPAGLRSMSTTGRQMLYRSGDCLLDLRMEPASQGVCVVGQIVRASDPTEAYRGARVALWDTSILAETTSNDFGEFMLEAETRTVAWVMVELAGRSPLVVRLPESARP